MARSPLRPPEPGSFSLAVVDARPVHLSSPNDPALASYLRAQGPLYLPIRLSKDMSTRSIPIHPSSSSPIASANVLVSKKPALSSTAIIPFALPSLSLATAYDLAVPLINRAYAWINGVRASVTLNPVIASAAAVVSNSTIVERFFPFIQAAFKNVMQPAATPSKPKTASTESLDSGSIIRSLAFHRHRSLLAVAHESNLVFLYNVSAKDGAYPERVLSHEYQRNITCMEFHPAAGCSLAVGTSTGVLLWRTHPRPTPTPWVTHLPTSPVSALSWSPSGTPLLCVGVHESATLYVFDADGLGMMPLRRYGGDGTREVQFSPNGRYLVQSCMTAQIRIWETDKWTCRELQMVAPVHSVNWMPDSKIFLHAIEGQSKIFGIGVSSSGISSVLQQRKSKDSNAPTFETREIIPEPVVDAEYDMPSGARISVGGEIERMTLDPMGRYLLVSFMSRGGNDDEAEDGSALLAVYSVATIPLPLFTLTGFVRGPEMRNEDGDDFKGKKKAREGDNEANGEGRRTEDARAIEVVFWGGVGGAGGAALVEALGCVGWENGEVGFLPFLRT